MRLLFFFNYVFEWGLLFFYATTLHYNVQPCMHLSVQFFMPINISVLLLSYIINYCLSSFLLC